MTNSVSDPLEPGSIFHGRYQVLRHLDAGGMGTVYEVLDVETQRRRALKTMLPNLLTDPEMWERFRREATIAANVGSEHIIDVFDAGADEATGLPFLVMDLLKGESVQAQLERRGRFEPSDVITVLYQTALALDRTHAAGIVHRDLKPENLFVSRRDDGSPRVIVLDFGIAKVVNSGSYAETTRSLGSPLYMSPEQIRGDGDMGPAADLYSLCHIAFALLTGQAYWAEEARQSKNVYGLLVRTMQGASVPASVRAARLGVALPKEFDAWFERATAPSPSSRFDSASELVERLARILGVALPGRGSLDPTKVPRQPDAANAVVPFGTRKRANLKGRPRVPLALLALGLAAAALVALTVLRRVASKRSNSRHLEPIPTESINRPAAVSTATLTLAEPRPPVSAATSSPSAVASPPAANVSSSASAKRPPVAAPVQRKPLARRVPSKHDPTDTL